VRVSRGGYSGGHFAEPAFDRVFWGWAYTTPPRPALYYAPPADFCLFDFPDYLYYFYYSERTHTGCCSAHYSRFFERVFDPFGPFGLIALIGPFDLFDSLCNQTPFVSFRLTKIKFLAIIEYNTQNTKNQAELLKIHDLSTICQ